MPIHTDGRHIFERCERCGRRWSWIIGLDDRIDNRRYLTAHVRDFCQPHGRTKKIYLKLYGEPNDNLTMERERSTEPI